MAVSEQTYDGLVDTIYGLIFGEATWEVFLDRLNAIIPGGRTTLFYHDAARSEGASHIDRGFDEKWVDAYARHFASINPWGEAMAGMPLWKGFVAEDMLPRADFQKTEFYNDFWRECGETGIGMTLLKSEGRVFNISSSIAIGEPEDNRVFANLLTRLAPHLHRAVVYFDSAMGPKPISEMDGRLFDAIGVGVVMVGRGGKLVSATDLGTQALESGRFLRLGFQGNVEISDPDARSRLTRMLADREEDERQQVLTVEGTKLTFIKLRKARTSYFFDAPELAVIIETPTPTVQVGDFVLRERFGLTKAEIRILHGLIQGTSINELAINANRSRETIRSQVKSIYAKTGARSQVELFRLVYFREQPKSFR